MEEETRIGNFKLLNYLKKHIFVNPSQKLIAILLALHRNDKTLQCNPGVTLLAKESGFSERYVRRILTQLIEQKLIYPARDSDHSRHYFFSFDFQHALAISRNPNSSMNGTRALLLKANKFRHLETASVLQYRITDKKKNRLCGPPGPSVVPSARDV